MESTLLKRPLDSWDSGQLVRSQQRPIWLEPLQHPCDVLGTQSRSSTDLLATLNARLAAVSSTTFLSTKSWTERSAKWKCRMTTDEQGYVFNVRGLISAAQRDCTNDWSRTMLLIVDGKISKMAMAVLHRSPYFWLLLSSRAQYHHRRPHFVNSCFFHHRHTSMTHE